jgi:hypothetical protein
VSKSADPSIKQAVKAGEISILKAWQWSRLSGKEQQNDLEELRGRKGTNQTSSRLIPKHLASMRPTGIVRQKLSDVLNPLTPDRLAILNSIVVHEIDVPGLVAYLTKEALQTLKTGEGAAWKT